MTHAAPIPADEFARLMAPFAVRPGAQVAVAVSGGADSLALALLLAEWGAAQGVRVAALSVDHRLRPEARLEAEHVHTWLTERGLDHHILTWDAGESVRSAVQARARDARYRLMADWCRARGAAHLFTAHHQGDQAETFLMRLKRSSTLFGLAAMAPTRPLAGGVSLCRPLLDVPKARLIATLKALGQPWIEDPSNRDPAFERVRTRALIDALGADGITPARLAGAARGARAVSDALDRAVAAFEARAVRGKGQDIAIEAHALAQLLDRAEPVARRVLTLKLQQVGGRAYPPAPDKIDRLARALARADFRAHTLGGCIVRRDAGSLTIRPEPPRSTQSHTGGTNLPLTGGF